MHLPGRHLDDAQMVDAVDGRLDQAAAAHLASCASCESRQRTLRDVLQSVAENDSVPEPSPLFWEHFPSRVRRAIDTPPQPQGWLNPSRWVWGAAAALVVLVLLLVSARQGSVVPPGNPQGDAAPQLAAVEPVPDDLDNDEAWAMVRAVAEAVDYDDVQEAGLTPRAGSVDRAASELSANERAELARLIAQELKGTGASLP